MLRVFFFIRFLGPTMFTATMNLVTGDYIILGTLKDRSVLINSLASNNCLATENNVKRRCFVKSLDFFVKKAQHF